jgi:flagellar motor protein MotB
MLMMAFANYDTPGTQTKAKIIAESFTKSAGQTELDLENMANEIALHPDFDKRTKVTLKDGELVIVFTGSAVFAEGSYMLDSQTLNMVDTLIEMIKNRGTEYRILIEGHADKNENLLSGNMNHWSLSAARSAGIIARFEYFGFKSEYMVALAKGDRDPIAEYKDKETKGVSPREISKLNRRAVIRILEPIGKKKVRMGLGVLFRDASEEEPVSDTSLFKEEN